MGEFVIKFDSRSRLVGRGFSQAAIPQQVTYDSDDCWEFYASCRSSTAASEQATAQRSAVVKKRNCRSSERPFRFFVRWEITASGGVGADWL